MALMKLSAGRLSNCQQLQLRATTCVPRRQTAVKRLRQGALFDPASAVFVSTAASAKTGALELCISRLHLSSYTPTCLAIQTALLTAMLWLRAGLQVQAESSGSENGWDANSTDSGSITLAAHRTWLKRQRVLQSEPHPSDADIIELNVGGSTMVTNRSTLRQVCSEDTSKVKQLLPGCHRKHGSSLWAGCKSTRSLYSWHTFPCNVLCGWARLIHMALSVDSVLELVETKFETKLKTKLLQMPSRRLRQV